MHTWATLKKSVVYCMSFPTHFCLTLIKKKCRKHSSDHSLFWLPFLSGYLVSIFIFCPGDSDCTSPNYCLCHVLVLFDWCFNKSLKLKLSPSSLPDRIPLNQNCCWLLALTIIQVIQLQVKLTCFIVHCIVPVKREWQRKQKSLSSSTCSEITLSSGLLSSGTKKVCTVPASSSWSSVDGFCFYYSIGKSRKKAIPHVPTVTWVQH